MRNRLRRTGETEGRASSTVDRVAASTYQELRALAHLLVRRHRIRSLQTTSLVHEAYVKLAGSSWRSRDEEHFLAGAAQAMRQVLMDQARRGAALKRAGGLQQLSLHDSQLEWQGPPVDVLAVDEALTRFAAIDPRKATVVELRFFGGLSVEEAARVTGTSAATVKRDWALAKAWLYRELSSDRSE